MHIDDACRAIRRCSDAIASYQVPAHCVDVPLAVVTLKRYLEQSRDDGQPLDELLISESMLLTPQGMRWVMAYVTMAEALEAAAHRARSA